MAKWTIALLLFIFAINPAFGADPVSAPPVVVDGTPTDNEHEQAYATVAITAALIMSAILYVTKNNTSSLSAPTQSHAWRVYIDENARVGIAFDL